MGKLMNRIRYGKSNKPRYIRSKHNWLYKNKWIDSNSAYEILSDKSVRYSYEISKNGYVTFGEVDSFDVLVDLVHKYSSNINFSDLSQFSMQEIDVLIGIKRKLLEEQSEKLRRSIIEANEEVARIQSKLWSK
jgi:hypothetical protein